MAYTLSGATRTIKGTLSRTATHIPAVVYGAGKDSLSLTLAVSEFAKLYKQAGESTLVDLQIDGKEAGKVLVQEIQQDPVSDRIIHVDLRRIDMNKAMTAPVTLKFVGEAPVIKAQGGTLVTNLQTVEVTCLPKDLVSHIDIDLSSLVTYDNIIKIKDLALPTGITIVSPGGEDLVAKAVPALTEEQIKAMEDANANADVSKIESAKPEKVAEGEEGAEGAAAAPAGAAAPAAGAPKKEEKEKK